MAFDITSLGGPSRRRLRIGNYIQVGVLLNSAEKKVRGSGKGSENQTSSISLGKPRDPNLLINKSGYEKTPGVPTGHRCPKGGCPTIFTGRESIFGALYFFYAKPYIRGATK